MGVRRVPLRGTDRRNVDREEAVTMRRGLRILASLAAVPLLLAFAAPAGATQGRAVPFAMHVVGVDRPLNMSPGFPFVRDLFDSRCTVASDWVTTMDTHGVAAHLGSVTVVQSHCTRIDIFTTPNPAVFGDGQMTITAANGDKLRLVYSGSFVFTPGDSPDVGVSAITYSTMTVVGGTGRFAGASGTISGHAVDHFPAGPNTADFSGAIVYDPSVQARS